jgi:hypothetical protein
MLMASSRMRTKNIDSEGMRSLALRVYGNEHHAKGQRKAK